MKKLALLMPLLGILFQGCTGIPDGIEPVTGFELERYLGQWYEIARLDHPFERGLSHVTATYRPREGGGVEVINRGYNADKQHWQEARGKAFFVDEPAVGRLKVSFFGPFYGAYNIFELDKQNYEYAMVCGPNRDYFWILARKPDMEPELLQRLVRQARELGFATDKLIYPEQGGMVSGER